MWQKLFALLLIISFIAPAVATPVINPSVESESYWCRLQLTAWICDMMGGSGGGTVSVINNYPVANDGTLINIYNFTSDAMNWTSDVTNIFYETGMNLTPNMTAGPQGVNGTPGADGAQGIQGIQGIQGDKGDTGSISDSTQFPFLNGSRTLTGIWNVGGYNLSNLLDPVSAQDAVTKAYVDAINATGVTDHGALTGLADDDHLQYANLPGRPSGQTLTGGTDANDDLILNGTSSSTKTSSYVILQPDSGFVGINTSIPLMELQVNGLIDALNFHGFDINTTIGYEAGFNNIGEYQTAIGYNAGFNNNGDSQTVTGYNAGFNNIGASQTATGLGAGYQNTGAYQMAAGEAAGYQNTGAYQTAIGYNAGPDNNGDSQTVIGSFAGFNNVGASQTAIGWYAGYQNTGAYQMAAGEAAGFTNNGDSQTVIGSYAGYQNSGKNQSAYGYYSGYGNTGNDVVSIGYYAGANNIESNRFIVQQQNINPTPLIYGDFLSGNVSIGTIQTLAKLQVNGTLLFPSFAGGTLMTDAEGNVYVVSDEKLKTDIKPLISGLTAIENTNPITYKFNEKSGLDTKNTYSGFSADNLKLSIPGAVFEKRDTTTIKILKIPSYERCEENLETKEKTCTIIEAQYETKEVPVLDKDGKQTVTLSISDRAIIATLVNAVKEQQAEITSQQAQIDNLTARLDKLEAKVR